jgi:hypothetical protein
MPVGIYCPLLKTPRAIGAEPSFRIFRLHNSNIIVVTGHNKHTAAIAN